MWTDRKCPGGSGEQHYCALPPVHWGKVGPRWAQPRPASPLSCPPARPAGCPAASIPRVGACACRPPIHLSPRPGCFQKARLLWVCPGDQRTHLVPWGKEGGSSLSVVPAHNPTIPQPSPLASASAPQHRGCSLQPWSPKTLSIAAQCPTASLHMLHRWCPSRPSAPRAPSMDRT